MDDGQTPLEVIQAEAWWRVNERAIELGWREDWLNDPDPEVINWFDYIIKRMGE